MTTLDTSERDLLGTYAGGPRIWDAAALLPTVLGLESKGLIEPVPDSAAYRLTDAGRSELPLDDPITDTAGYLPCGCHGSQPDHTCKS